MVADDDKHDAPTLDLLGQFSANRIRGMEQLTQPTGNLSDDEVFAQVEAQPQLKHKFTLWQNQILNMHRFDVITVAHSSVVWGQPTTTAKSVSI